jgi:hypothetical protein
MHRLKERLDRKGCLPLRHVAAATLLVQTAESWVVPLERREGLEGRSDLSEEPLRNGRRQERIALAGRLGEQRVSGRQSLGEALLPQQLV